MSKKEFMAILRLKLSSLHAVEQEMFINFYEEIIQDMMENGMTEEEAVAKQGDISEIANNILADIGGNKETKKKAKRFKNIAIVVLVIIGILIGYTVIQGSKKIAEKKVKVDVKIKDENVDVNVQNDEKNYSYTVIEGGSTNDEKARLIAKDVINMFNAGKYEEIGDKYASDIMKEYFTTEYMLNAKYQVAKDFGELKETGVIYTSVVEQEGKRYSLCTCTCIYKNVTITYSVVLNEDYMVDGFFMN